MGRAHEVRKASMLKTSLAKSKVYAKFGKEIYMAAKAGEPDPSMNLTLKRVIEKAKSAQVPNDVIKRNIEKAKGGIGEDYVPYRYEGFGPGGSQIIVDCLTDNVNRTVSEVRNCFTKTGSKMGVSGCVEHMFKHLAIVSVKGINEEEALETLLMADVEINEIEEVDGIVNIEAPANELYKIKESLTEFNSEIQFLEAEADWIPLDTVKLDNDDDKKRFDKFINMANECEDVQEIYHNVELDN